MSKNVQTIVDLIRKETDLESLRAINRALQLQYRHASAITVSSLDKGDHVSFEGRRGQTVTGYVEKVNQKTVKVRAEDTGLVWKVSGCLLTKIA